MKALTGLVRGAVIVLRLQRNVRSCSILGVMLTLVSGLMIPDSSVRADEGHVGAALDGLFNVRRAPEAKAMGIFQGSFLEALSARPTDVQIAFVLDVTESMEGELEGIRQNLPQLVQDIQRAVNGKTEVAVVTYADSGTRNKPVKILGDGFTADSESIQSNLAAIKQETGRPYFPEVVDLGVHRAIQDLAWRSEDHVKRWVFLIGDAPPYDESFQEAGTHSQRWFDTDLLVNLANTRKINVHCLLCKSRPEELEAYEQSVEKARQFMGQLSSRTGGLMLDLSFDRIRSKILEDAKRERAEFAYIGPISERDIEAARGTMMEDDGAAAILRVAVLPHLDLDEMTFFHEHPSVQFATQTRYLLRRMPGIQVVPANKIETELLRLKSSALPLEQWPQALCLRLGVDVLVTGDLRQRGDVQDVQSEWFTSESPEPIARISASGTEDDLLGSYWAALGQVPTENQIAARLVAKVSQEDGTQLRDFWPGILSKLDTHKQRDLLSALELLEESLDLSIEPALRKADLQTAFDLLEGVRKEDAGNAFAAALQASASFNLAKTLEQMGQVEEATSKMAIATQLIKLAFDGRQAVADRLLRLEIEADFALLVQKEFRQAMDKYGELTKFTEASPLHMALRAHWMMAGIESGDWGAAQQENFQPDPQKARQHLIAILAFWPDSTEARTIRKYMQWNEEEGGTTTPYFPREGELLITAK